MLTSLPTKSFSRRHFDNAVMYTESVSRAHHDRLVRRHAALTVAYVKLMDELTPGWRDVVVASIVESVEHDHIMIGDIGLEAVDPSTVLYFSTFRLVEAKMDHPPSPLPLENR